MTDVVIAGIGHSIDHKYNGPYSNTLPTVEKIIGKIPSDKGYDITNFYVDSLKDWHTDWKDQKEFHASSGAGYFQLLEKAYTQIKKDSKRVFIISGQEDLLSRYSSGAERTKAMKIYSDAHVHEVYNDLAIKFIESSGFTKNEFLDARELLITNYLRTLTENDASYTPTVRRNEIENSLYRLCDCAFPLTNKKHLSVVMSKEAAQNIGLNYAYNILGVATESIHLENKRRVSKAEKDIISKYDHFHRVFATTIQMAGIDDYVSKVMDGRIFNEFYSCFPNVVLAHMKKTGLYSTFGELSSLLERVPVTVSGGANLSKAGAAWNFLITPGVEIGLKKLKEGQIFVSTANGGAGEVQGCLAVKKVSFI